MVEGFGAFLRRMRRERGLTLREVYDITGVSGSYLSQLESGERTRIGPRYLGKLAEAYGIPLKEMVAREVTGGQDDEVRREQERAISRAFEFVVRDPDFEHGEGLSGKLSIEAKHFIVEMYEKLRGRRLLSDPTLTGLGSPETERPGEGDEGGDDGEDR